MSAIADDDEATPSPGRPSPARTRRALLAGVVLVVAATVGVRACSPPVTTIEQRTARDAVVALTRLTAMASYRQDIDDFARAATGSGFTVVDIDRRPLRACTLGHLTFLLTVEEPATGGKSWDWFGVRPDHWDPGPYCFRVAFDRHGKVGERGTADGIDPVPCPEHAAPVTH